VRAALVSHHKNFSQKAVIALQQNPIVVEVIKQPEPTRDISIDVVLGMFAMAGVLLAAAAIGSAIVAGLILLYKRRRDASTPHTQHSHTTLRI
jgi:hypothetical protein